MNSDSVEFVDSYSFESKLVDKNMLDVNNNYLIDWLSFLYISTFTENTRIILMMPFG